QLHPLWSRLSPPSSRRRPWPATAARTARSNVLAVVGAWHPAAVAVRQSSAGPGWAQWPGSRSWRAVLAIHMIIASHAARQQQHQYGNNGQLTAHGVQATPPP